MGKHKVKRHPWVVYTVWDNRTDELLILDATAEVCAQQLGIKVTTFFSLASQTRKGKRKRYTIETRRVTSNDVDGILGFDADNSK